MQQSFQFRKKKITPLFLLGQIKKNNSFPFNKDRQSALTFVEHRDIKNKYGELLPQHKPIKTEIKELAEECAMEVIGKDYKQGDNKQKISQILRKTQRKPRYTSANKTAIKKKIQNSPYFSLQKRKSQPNGNRLDFARSSENKSSILKVRLQSKLKMQISLNISNESGWQSKRVVSGKIDNIPQIFIHYSNLCKIAQVIQSKKKQREVLPIIRIFVLEEQGDPSCIEHMYASVKDCEDAKRILFLQKVLVILIVDLIINLKFKHVENFVKGALKLMIGFYEEVYKDLEGSSNIGRDELKGLEMSTLLKPGECPTEPIPGSRTFHYIFTCLSAKLKSCFKYSRQLEQYCKLHLPRISVLSSNLSYFRLLQYYSHFLLSTTWSNWCIDFLETCPSPYLHYETNKRLTLVLDLDETLIHYKINNNNNFQGEFLIRPYMFEFLEEMAEHFELGIFTCSMPEYADIIINHMKHIDFRLYRHHTVKIKGEYIKDLSRIGRDLRSLILVDNLEQNYRLQKENGITIRSWYGDRSDDFLRRLANELAKLAKMGVEDVRIAAFERKFL